MNTSHLTSAVLAAVIILSSPIATLSQDRKKPDQGSIKLNAELVQIDALVTDKAGKPVSGLKREDFELYDNNKPQPITHFSYEESNAGRAKNSPAGQPPIPKAITARELKRVVAFVVDTLHMQFENLYRTRKMLQDFVDNQMAPGDLVLILPSGGGSGLLQQFTSDRSLLRNAINRLKLVNVDSGVIPYRSITSDVRFRSAGRVEQPVDSRNRGSGNLSMPDSPGSHDTDPLEMADVRVTLETLNNVITSMRQLPGRKLGVFVSEGFRLFPTQTLREFGETIGLAARSNVVFYSIDPKGLGALFTAADSFGSDVANGGGLGQAVAQQLIQNQLDLLDARESLSSLAAETGGKLFSNNNDINKGLANLLDENSSYYLLGFQPESARWDGKLHKIKVVVRNRPDLTVLARKSYLARSDAPKPPSADPKAAEAIEAISSPLARRDIDLRLTALYIDNAQREPSVTLLLHIDASKLQFIESEGSYHSSLEQIGFVLDATGRTVESFSNTLQLNLQPKTFQAALKQGFVATRTMNVKPGIYQIRLFVREVGFGLIGTANDFIEIPDLKAADRLSASSLFLAGQTAQQGKTADAAGATPSQRKFQRNGEFSYSMVIYNARIDEKTKQPQLEMRTRILNGSKVVFAGQPHPVAAGEGSALPYRVVTGGVIKPLNLPAGDYSVEVIVWDTLRKKDSIIRRETDFSVE
jgi:VWFA-related protein